MLIGTSKKRNLPLGSKSAISFVLETLGEYSGRTGDRIIILAGKISKPARESTRPT